MKYTLISKSLVVFVPESKRKREVEHWARDYPQYKCPHCGRIVATVLFLNSLADQECRCGKAHFSDFTPVARRVELKRVWSNYNVHPKATPIPLPIAIAFRSRPTHKQIIALVTTLEPKMHGKQYTHERSPFGTAFQTTRAGRRVRGIVNSYPPIGL